jgi:hypothetical protein
MRASYNFSGILEYGNAGIMGNIVYGGPRSVVAGRDGARLSKNKLKNTTIPVFHHSIIPIFLSNA